MEEKRILKEFGKEYRVYKERTPMFFPGRNQWRQFIKFSQGNLGRAQNPD